MAVWHDPDGNEVARLFAKKGDADRQWQAQETDVARGAYTDPAKARVKVGEFCDLWLAGYASRRDSTVRQARVHVRQIKAEFGRRRLRSVTPTLINVWTARLKAEGYEASYIYALYSRLSQIMSAAAEDGLVDRNPCSRKTSPGAGKQRAYVLSTEQLWQLYAAFPVMLRPAVLMGALAGMRVSEAAGCRPDDIDVMAGFWNPAMQYPAEPLKTETSMTPVPIPPGLVTEVIAHMAQFPGDTILNDGGKQIGPWRLERAMRSARKKVPGLPQGFRYQDLRHYLASFLIAQGADVKLVQARMRHASAKTTLDTYGHLWPDKDESTRTALEAVFRGRPEIPSGVTETPGSERLAPKITEL
jgi:integrase